MMQENLNLSSTPTFTFFNSFAGVGTCNVHLMRLPVFKMHFQRQSNYVELASEYLSQIPLSVDQFLIMCFYFLLHSWDRKNNPEPWNKMAPTDQYKVCQPRLMKSYFSCLVYWAEKW